MQLKNRLRRAGLVIGLLLLLAQAALASDVDMLHVLRPKSDLRIKIETILNAREYIDFITYHHDNTESSALIMEALRLAASRGVHVRYIYDAMATNTGFSDFSPEYLAKLQASGVEVKTVTKWDRVKTWGAFKLIHSKMLVADSGHGQEVTIVGGRNIGDRYMDWLDNTFVFHYRTPAPLSNNLTNYFNKLWSYLSKVSYSAKLKEPTEKTYSSEEELRAAVDEKFGSVTGDADVEAYRRFLRGTFNNSVPHFHFDFSEIRFVTSGMIDQIYKQPKVDEVAQVFQQMTTESKNLEMSTILFYLSPEKRQVLQGFLKNKGNLSVSTNQLNSFSAALGPNKGPMAKTLEKMQENEFVDLSKYGNKVQTFVFKDSEFVYNHAKYIIGDDSVLVTSSNFNYSSDMQGEENGFFIKSASFANYMRKYNEDVRFRFFNEIEYEKGTRLNFLEKSCRFILKNVF